MKIAVFIHIIYNCIQFETVLSRKTVSKIKWHPSENPTFQNIFQNRNYYLQKSFEIFWILTKNLKNVYRQKIAVHTLKFSVNFLLALTIALLVLPIFLLYEVRPLCKCFLSNLARRYTRITWHAGRLSIFTSNQIGGIASERVYSVIKQL